MLDVEYVEMKSILKALNLVTRKAVNNMDNKRLDKLKDDFFNDTGVDIASIDDDDFDSFEESVMQAIDEQSDIIYYSNAMKFLSEHDGSLRESVDVALEYGMELKDVNSETLASILNLKMNRDTWYGVRDEFEECFEDE